MSNENEREIVLDTLLLITRDNEYSHIALKSVLDKYGYLDKRSRSFVSKAVNGTLERMIEINYIINTFSTVKVNKLKPVIRAILQSSIYQIKYMDHVPDSAICNEAVKLTGKRGFKNLKGFVNGVLRNISRNKDSIELNTLELKYSLPKWIVDMWSENYSKETICRMGEYFLNDAPLYIWFNKARISAEDLIDKLKLEGVDASRVDDIPCALQITKIDSFERLESFNNGYYSIQDISSMLVELRAKPKEKDIVLDVCAAPGGKAIHFAEDLNGTGEVIARDISEYKTSLIQSNIDRSGLMNIKTEVWDATVPDESRIDSIDIVVADLPCSGLGVIGRKPDMKYKVEKKDIYSLSGLQRDILAIVKQYVKPGGKLIYSTCTITREENQENTKWFLKGNPEFALKYEEQRIPGVDIGDGFYIAIFERAVNE
ncbi:MAG: 16S rRNA (cytosine(967)-C(5))-methyltransferase RsmB [Suipraeoptans sp.]